MAGKRSTEEKRPLGKLSFKMRNVNLLLSQFDQQSQEVAEFGFISEQHGERIDRPPKPYLNLKCLQDWATKFKETAFPLRAFSAKTPPRPVVTE